ncbi:MAG: hypothetical protein QXW70_02785 [Candidatus Anstonellales archaeon]
MVDFWVQNGWYKISGRSYSSSASDVLVIISGLPRYVRLTRGRWTEESTRIAAVKFLVEEVLKKDPRDITQFDFHSNRLAGLLNSYYSGFPYAALKEAGLVSEADEAYMRSCQHTR